MISVKSKNIKTYFLLIFFGVFLHSSEVYAGRDFDTRIDPEEKAVFAFFRAANTAVDYDFWIKTNKNFLAFNEQEQREVYFREQMRLGYGYGNYDLDKDPLKLNIDIIAQYKKGTDEERPRIEFRFFGLNNENIPIFNYAYGDGTISLLIKDIEKFKSLPLSPSEEKAVLEKIPYTDSEFDARLEVEVKVTEADYENPVKIRDEFQWFMKGQVAYIRCNVSSYYSSESTLIWDYVAPWFEEVLEERNKPEELKYPHPYDLFKD